MHNIDDSIHQLFSQLLLKSRSNDPVSFESNIYKSGSGFKICNPNGDFNFHLHDATSLIGFSHPLKIKSNFIAAISAEPYINKESTHQLILDIESFFSKLYGKNLYINASKQENKVAKSPGRYSRFFSEEDFVLLEKKDLNIDYVLPFSFSLSSNKSEQKLPPITTEQAIFSQALLKLLKLGQFYDHASLLNKRSLKLKSRVQDLSFISEVNGLTFRLSTEFELERLLKKGIHCTSHEVALPLFYDDNDLDDLICLLQEEFKCL